MTTSAPPLFIKRPQVKTVPYYNYLNSTVLHYSSRVETVQYIRRYYCPFFLPAPRSNSCRARAVLHTRYPIICSVISTSLSTCRRSNDFCAPRRNTARPIYFLCGHLHHHSDIDGHLLRRHIYIYNFMRWYLHHRNVTERQFLAQPEGSKDKDHQQCFCFLFFCVLFLFHGRL